MPAIVNDLAYTLCAAAGTSSVELIARHEAGDWGTVDDAAKAMNTVSQETGGAIMSRFALTVDVLVTTEADGQISVIALGVPEPYARATRPKRLDSGHLRVLNGGRSESSLPRAAAQ